MGRKPNFGEPYVALMELTQRRTIPCISLVQASVKLVEGPGSNAVDYPCVVDTSSDGQSAADQLAMSEQTRAIRGVYK